MYWQFLTATILAKVGQREKAISLIKDTLRVSPNDDTLLNFLQTLYRDSGNWALFFEIYESQRNLNPNDISLRRNFGTALMFNYRFDEALPHLEYCVENWNLDETYSHILANTYARLGICYSYLERWELSKNALDMAQKMVPWDSDVVYGLLLFYMGTHQIEKIQDYLNELILAWPKIYTFYYWKAYFTYYYLHNTNESLVLYKKAFDLMINRRFDVRFFSYYFSTQNDASPENVTEEYSSALARSNKAARGWLVIYSGQFKLLRYKWDVNQTIVKYNILLGKFGKANKKCLQMIKRITNPYQLSEYWSLLALTQIKAENLEDGMFSVNKAIQLNPNAYLAWETLATLYVMKKEWTSAIATFEQMSKMEPSDSSVYSRLAFCYENIGDIPQACKYYEKATFMNKYDAEAWVDLANIYLQQQKNDLASKAFQEAVKYKWLSTNKLQIAHQALSDLNTKQRK